MKNKTKIFVLNPSHVNEEVLLVDKSFFWNFSSEKALKITEKLLKSKIKTNKNFEKLKAFLWAE